MISIPALTTYTGKPCVYVRWVDGHFYIGRTINLTKRYLPVELQQVIYFEEWDTVEEAIMREAMLINDFKQANLPLANIAVYPNAHKASKKTARVKMHGVELEEFVRNNYRKQTNQQIASTCGVSLSTIEKTISALKRVGGL